MKISINELLTHEPLIQYDNGNELLSVTYFITENPDFRNSSSTDVAIFEDNQGETLDTLPTDLVIELGIDGSFTSPDGAVYYVLAVIPFNQAYLTQHALGVYNV